MDNVQSTSVTPPAQPSGLSSEIKNHKNKMQLVLIGVVILLILIIFGLTAYIIVKYTTNQNTKQITNFAECMQAGYPVMESFPRQCRTPEGQLFVEEIDVEIDDGKDENSNDTEQTIDNSQEDNQSEDTSNNTNAQQNNNSNNNQQSNENNVKTVKVYFGHDEKSFSDPNYTESVNRTTTRNDVEVFAIEELIKGPTEEEQDMNLANFFLFLDGESNCNGKDFTLSVSNKVATLQFCKDIIPITYGETVENSFKNTLTQFDSIDTVVIKYKNGGINPFSLYYQSKL